jgi:predicted PurR-regulated permease PerM
MPIKSSRGIQRLFITFFIISSLFLTWLFFPFLPILIIGSVVSSIFRPVYIALVKKMIPVLASIITCFLIFVILFIPISFFVGVISKEAYDIAKSPEVIEKIKTLIEQSQVIEKTNILLSFFDIKLTGAELKNAVAEIVKITGLFLYDQASSIASNVVKFFFNFVIMLIVIFFLLMDGHRFIDFIKDLSPLPDEHDDQLIDKFKETAFAILIINGLSGLVQGTMGGTVFALFGFQSPIVWGLVLGLAAFLPIIGIPAIFIPVAIFLILNDRIGAGIFFIVFALTVSFIVDNLIKPKLLGDRVKIHPLLVFLSILGGLNLFGMLGIIYGPLIVTTFLTLTNIYRSTYQKIIENDT